LSAHGQHALVFTAHIGTSSQPNTAPNLYYCSTSLQQLPNSPAMSVLTSLAEAVEEERRLRRLDTRDVEQQNQRLKAKRAEDDRQLKLLSETTQRQQQELTETHRQLAEAQAVIAQLQGQGSTASQAPPQAASGQ
jgi:hypothetical protein